MWAGWDLRQVLLSWSLRFFLCKQGSWQYARHRVNVWIKGIQWSTKKREPGVQEAPVLGAAAVIVTVGESSNPLAGPTEHLWPSPCTLSSFASHDLVPTSLLRSEVVPSSQRADWDTFTHRTLLFLTSEQWISEDSHHVSQPLYALCLLCPSETLHRSFIMLLGLCILFPPLGLKDTVPKNSYLYLHCLVLQ